jgi:hypothetical protein
MYTVPECVMPQMSNRLPQLKLARKVIVNIDIPQFRRGIFD